MHQTTKKRYTAPIVTDLGSAATLTQNGFSQGNDVGKGKSGGKGGSKGGSA